MTKKKQLKIRRSEELDEILSAMPHWMIRWGLSIIFIIILCIIFGSWIIPYPDVIVGDAFITTEKKPALVHVKTPGNLTALYAKEGEKVKKGQLIGELYNAVQKNQIDFLTEIILLSDSLLKDEEIHIDILNKNIVLGHMQEEFLQLKELLINYQKLKDPYYNNILLQIKQHKNQQLEIISIFSKKLKIAEKNLLTSTRKYKIYTEMYEENILPHLEFLEYQSEYNNSLNEVENVKYSILQNKIILEDLDKKLNDLIFQQLEQKNKLILDIEFTKERLENYIIDWKQVYTISAPASGILYFTERLSEGSYLESEKPILAILPEDSELNAIIKVMPNNYGKIKTDQKVIISLSNYPYQEYGYLIGTITKKSTLPVDNKYEIISEINTLKTTYGKEINYQPNMIGQAEIIMEEKNVLESIFYSFRKLIKS